MNQKYFVLNLPRPLRLYPDQVGALREQSPSQSRIKNPESKITSSSNPFLLLLCLSLLSSFTSFAWDDDDEFDAPSRSSHNNSSLYSTSTKSVLQHEDVYSIKQPTSPQQAYEATRARALHVDTIQEANDKRALRNQELMAESQRSFEQQEAQQEKSRAQMAKQQEIYHEMDHEETEMAEFLGGVYKAKFGATTGHNSAVTTEGYVFRSGDNFITPKGIYTKSGNIFTGPDGITTQTGTLFFGNESTTIQAGGAYFSEGKSGFIVSPSSNNREGWRTR